MKEKLRTIRQPSHGRIEVIVALIGAIGAILAAIITVGLPIIMGQNNAPTVTITPSAPTSPPEESAPTSFSAPTSPPAAPAPASPPTESGVFPCDATVDAWNAVDLNVVRDFPNQGAMLREPVKVGAAVRVIDISGTDPPWYRIASPEGRVLGWIPAEYLRLAATCPQA